MAKAEPETTPASQNTPEAATDSARSSYDDPDNAQPETDDGDDTANEAWDTDDEDEDVAPLDVEPEIEEPEDEAQDDETPEDDDTTVIPATALRRQRTGLDPDVAAILRDEANRDAAERSKSTSETFDSQPDLDIAPTAPKDPDVVAVERTMARLRGEPAAGGPGARRELLPDIEEINSSLSPSSDRGLVAEDQAEVEHRQRGGFRLGFGVVVGVALLGAAIYSYAPLIGEKVPALSPGLTAYSEWVDGLRLWLDLKMQAIMTQMNGTPDGQ